MSIQYGIITGPGHHRELMIEAFKQKKIPFRYATYWPTLKVFEVSSEGKETVIYYSIFYGCISKILWSIWPRISPFNKRRLHRDWLLVLYDRLICTYFDECKLVIGWSQVSLYTMKRVKANGGNFFLEHPMVHVDYWNREIKKEYSIRGKVKNAKSLRSKAMIMRMKAEYNLADRINLLSTFSKKTFLLENIPDEKLIITPLCTDIDTSNSKKVTNKSENKFVVLYVGRLELLKGIQYLLEAVRMLNLVDVELWLVGAVQDEIRYTLSQYKGYYCLLGEKKRMDLERIYTQVDIVVFPSLMDAFGLVIIEALAAGTPVVATSSSAAEDIMKQEDCGLIIPPADSTAIRDAILHYYRLWKAEKLEKVRFDMSDYRVNNYQKILGANIGIRP